MLTPCNPCVCRGAPCEQCMFGYLSKVDAHDLMKKLILCMENGGTPVGRTLVETYKSYHPNWKNEMKGV